VAGKDIVAVVDIGSNSIKSLAATLDPADGLVEVQTGAIDARISAGLGRAQPRLSEEGMQNGLAAIRELLSQLAAVAPTRTVLVATSAVRDAANGGEFRKRIRTATGHEVRILTGDEEANLIGRGLTSDPALADLRDFYVFDLGGGSLECLAFRARRVEQALSLPLGCVRLTERCVDDPSAPFSGRSRTAVTAFCRETLAKSGFRFSLPPNAAAVFAGGTITTVRAIFAEQSRQPLDGTSPVITVEALRALLDDTARLPLKSRKQIAGMPPARADVFPTALATVLAVAEAGGISAFRHSFRNLRYGLAAELLAAPQPRH
jgi:exopolyphosphatase/guanosine-5'-triphosphate,3'-diphosphate pyrophosphatase